MKTFTDAKKSIQKMVGKGKPEFRGGVDGISGGILFGWIMHKGQPGVPVEVDIAIDGKAVGKVCADLPRADISAAAPFGGRCGFRFDLRPYLSRFPAQVEVRESKTGFQPTGSPLKFEQGSGWGSLDQIIGTEVTGWAVVAGEEIGFPMIEFFSEGKLIGTTVANKPRPDLQAAGIPQVRAGFSFKLPASLFDGQEHQITARVLGNPQPLRGEPKRFRAAFRGHIDDFHEGGVSGWAINLFALREPVHLDIYLNDRLVVRGATSFPRQDVVEHMLEAEAEVPFAGFGIPFPKGITLNPHRANMVRVCISGTDHLVGTDIAYRVPGVSLIEALEGFSNDLFAERFTSEELEKELAAHTIRKELIPALLREIRSRAEPFKAGVVPGALASGSLETLSGRHPIDVIVPVYKGFEETVDCIQSVLNAKVDCAYELIVINDQSPDPELTSELRKLAAKHKFTLLENEKNKGFVGTVNRGMKLHANRDVILLNSDAVVTNGWLDRLNQAAYSAQGIATVTPFSNRATICSLPRTCFDNDLPDGYSAEDLNQICARLNPGVVVDIPTAIGFCMYIRRDALNEVGYFDEALWAKGYCEENDFCIRATTLGWRNVAACDVFVQHHGSISFEGEKEPRVRENLAKLNAIYPDYPGKIQRFLRTDPLAAPRNRVNIELFEKKAGSKRYMLFVTHGLGGGTDVALQGLIERLKAEGQDVLVLRANVYGAMGLTSSNDEVISDYPAGTAIYAIAQDLKKRNVWHMHIHHTIGFDSDIWELPRLLGVEYDFTAHDFFPLCPRINLIDGNGEFCEQPEVETCEKCVKKGKLPTGSERQFKSIGGTAIEWRTFHQKKLVDARKVFTPSRDTADRLLNDFMLTNLQPLPHPEVRHEVTLRSRPLSAKQLTVAVLGAIGPHKGLKTLLACARYAERHHVSIRFVVIGYTSSDEEFEEVSNVVITGQYKKEDLPRLIEQYQCEVALFVSGWPETFSYTLSEAWDLGLYPVAFDLGAPAERIREAELGTLIPFSSDPKVIVTALMNARDAISKSATAQVGTDYQSIMNDYYAFGDGEAAKVYHLPENHIASV